MTKTQARALYYLSYLAPVTLHRTCTMHMQVAGVAGKPLGTLTARVPIRIRNGKVSAGKPKLISTKGRGGPIPTR